MSHYLLHGYEIQTRVRVDPEDVDDIRMVERGGRFGLLHESPLALGVGDLLGRQDFHRDFPVEPGIQREVYRTAAFPEPGFDPVMAERLADQEQEPGAA